MLNRYRLPVLAAAGVWTGVAFLQSAEGHGIAGNRYFPGTLSFDDPAVADELVFQPTVHDAHSGGAHGDYADNTLDVAFARLLTARLAIGVDSSWTHRDYSGFPDQKGFGPTSLTLKGLVYRNDPHETLFSAALSWRIGGSGSAKVAADQPTALELGLFFGQGCGALPDSMAWLRPFGVAGAVSLELPVEHSFTNTVHWGFALEYSTLYLTSRFTGGPATQEPLDQFVPLVELSFDTPFTGGRTTGTISPGLTYVGKVYQLALEASLPINRDSGRGVGGRMQLLFFLDDFLPALFEKPVFGGS